MAAASTRASTTFSVQGRVFDASSRNGVAGLQVTIHGLGPEAQATRGPTLDGLLKQAARVGSVLTDSSGAFDFKYDQDDIAAVPGDRKRLDILLVVSAPDDEGGAAGGVLYFSKPPRLNAGRVETFNIGISRETLEKFGLGGDPQSTERIDAYRRERKSEQQFADGVVEYHKEAVEEEIKERKAFRNDLLGSIATNFKIASLPGELVGDEDEIPDKVDAVTERAVARANAGINTESEGVRVNLYLTENDRARLKVYFDQAVDGFATIPEHELQDILFRRNSSENPGTLLVHQNPIAKFCAEQTFEEKCARIHTGLSPENDEHEHEGGAGSGSGTGTGTGGESGGGPTTNTIAALTNEDIPKHAARLLSSAPSPDDVLTKQFNSQRMDRETVEKSVDAFALRAGPADVPAFYDFQSLQIAFEHVWKVLLDEEMVDSAYALERRYQQKTGVSLKRKFTDHWADRLRNGIRLYETIPQEVPADVLAQFDVTLEEWVDLSATLQTKLKDIARELGVPCVTKTKVNLPGNLGTITVPTSRMGTLNCERKRQDLREQGERLIDSVRHDDYYTLHKTLRDLHDRINGAYEFTVFAADKNSHSVNFGLLNTYRQQWAPINYQAGKLVKTIPLSPKEERKYSLKINRNLKHTQKQAVKNNSSITAEQSSTSRVEAEIMAKAQSKTNFQLSAEGNYNIGISKGKSTTTFGVEAQQESSSSRKDFREAVLKAVQDYKEERSVQVDTEESSSSEYTESGSIFNPNEEIGCTNLFYELQRRYRVSEQLYRVQPVVLVAQEVPAPHQITESWVISHDWIINRYLLDDSFRPALAYLANKSVGDDFALRELRKNLRQQRNLVETLRIELSIASNEAENRYRSLESAIENRIGEEEAEETDGWFSDVGDFFGGGGQSPESAKARELAAKDAHQYAVEKAEKAAAAMRQEVNNLHTLTAEYNDTLRNHLDNETRVKRLLVHIRNNIFYYMQAIWSMEPPDQRFLRLHKVQVPQLELARIPDPADPNATIPDRQYTVEVAARDDIFAAFREPGTTKHRAFMTGRLQKITHFKALVEVADLDNLLGFKGNYMIFPLKEHNALTEFMAAPYVDAAFGAMDPDELSNVNLNDFGKYVCCLHHRLPAAKFEALKPQLKAWLEELLADPLRNGDEIVVPTGSLFIETLPGTHPLLENFKLRHRELDVYKVQEEVRKAGMESLRLAARLINEERGDPDVEKKIVVNGNLMPAIDVDN
jgi:hypothetical protein